MVHLMTHTATARIDGVGGLSASEDMKEEEHKDTPSWGTKCMETAYLRIVTRTQGVRISFVPWGEAGHQPVCHRILCSELL